jgi:hypothetical protein
LARNTHPVAQTIVAMLLEEPLCEASVHRPKRGQVWVATFTGPAGGQIWRSTGLTDYDQAFVVAKQWEVHPAVSQHATGVSGCRPVKVSG